MSNAPRRCRAPRLLISSCGLIRSISARSTVGVICLTTVAATRYGIACVDDRAGLVGRALGLGQLLQGEEPAVGRRILVEEDLLCPLARRDVQERVHAA